MDTLSPYIDWSSVQVLETSHPMNLLELNGGILRFDFPQIWLADSTTNEPLSHGHVVYRVKENPGNGSGIGIANTASIYFDWNDPVVTNTTWNVNADLAVIDNQQAQFVVYPNPFEDRFDIAVNGVFEADSRLNAELMTADGRLVQSYNGTLPELNARLNSDMNTMPSGLYLLRIVGGESQVLRLVKQ
jgi:hypothetical protein